MKYFGRMNLSRIKNLNWEENGSQIWRLCKATANLILDNLSRQSGNGKPIKIWEDKIMGSDPLEEQQDLQTLRQWTQSKGITHLHDMAEWNMHTGLWKKWKLEDLPPHLEGQQKILFSLLKGKAPISVTQKYFRIW